MSVQAFGIGDPAQAATGDAGNAEGNSVAGAEFGLALAQELGEGAVDVAEAEEAEVAVNVKSPPGLKPHQVTTRTRR
jgi:hypothetical protein